MNRFDAKYVIQEINNLPYYQHKINELKEKIDEVQSQIDNATAPHSPQGIENTGAAKAVSFSGKESYLNLKITEKDRLTKMSAKFSERYVDAQLNYYMILDNTEEKDYVKDYFSGKFSKQELEMKYSVTKAYRKILNVVMDCMP